MSQKERSSWKVHTVVCVYSPDPTLFGPSHLTSTFLWPRQGYSEGSGRSSGLQGQLSSYLFQDTSSKCLHFM